MTVPALDRSTVRLRSASSTSCSGGVAQSWGSVLPSRQDLSEIAFGGVNRRLLDPHSFSLPSTPTTTTHCFHSVKDAQPAHPHSHMDSYETELHAPALLQQEQQEQEREREWGPKEGEHKGRVQGSALINPTLLPEIAAIIAQYLTNKRDIATCALVCRTWFMVFTLHLWKEINSRIPNPEHALLLPSALEKHGGSIRKLTILDMLEHWGSPTPEESSTLKIFDCPSIKNVTHLVLSTTPENKHWFRNMIHRNQYTIRHLDLKCVTKDSLMKMPDEKRERCILFDFPETIPYLHSLTLHQWALTRRELVQILKACPTLKTFSLSGVRISSSHASTLTIGHSAQTTQNSHDKSGITGTDTDTDSKNSNSDNTCAKHRDPEEDDEEEAFQHVGLEMFKMSSTLYPILDLVPNIKVLEFYRFDRPAKAEELEQFCNSIRIYCHQLHEIWAFGFECSMLPPVLDSIPGRLTVYRGANNMGTVTSILKHAATLEIADLSDFTEQTHQALQFLETCPKLREFWTGYTSMTMTEVQESIRRGWVSKDLTKLRLSILKLPPALIEEVMQDLNAERIKDHEGLSSSFASALSSLSMKSSRSDMSPMTMAAMMSRNVAPIMSGNIAPQSAWTALQQLQDPQTLQTAMRALNPEQSMFQEEFSAYLRGLSKLAQVNFATGWYTIPRSAHC